MGSKKNLIIGGLLLILMITLSIIYFCLPKIDMKIIGKKNITLGIGELYLEQGASATLKKFSNAEKLEVKITGKVDTNKIGKYIITYTSHSKKLKKEMVRIINVIDDKNPEITLKKEIVGCKKNNLIEYDIEVIDDYDGNITDKIKYQIEDDTIKFVIYDSSHNKTELIEKIKFIDKEKPIIKLNNEKNIYLTKGTSYEEYGATAYDSCDGNISSKIKITQNINVDVPGIYEVNYSVVDSSNIVSQEKRYVTIVEDFNNIEYKVQNGATIYLTFDDGPGPYTEKILDILDEYNVKATFFVTGQFPNYQYLIKEEFNRGHSIGIHTYSHKWSIYESVESYFEDFKKIENIIFEETGQHPKIFRFPGGSSNTISKNYSKGIMTTLSSIMIEKGYKYYDWTFDSGDTNKKDNSTNAIIKNFKSNLKGDGEYIVLMHDIKKNTLEALPEIIKFAMANGYDFDNITDETIAPPFKISN